MWKCNLILLFSGSKLVHKTPFSELSSVFDALSREGNLFFNGCKLFWLKFGLCPWSGLSHLKKLHPNDFDVDDVFFKLQVKNNRPWLGPGFETLRRFDLLPHGQSGGVDLKLIIAQFDRGFEIWSLEI